MLIGNKVFPYPLLRPKDKNTDYKTSSFHLEFNEGTSEVLEENGYIILKNIQFHLDNEEILKFYKQGILKIVCIIECSKTFFKELFDLTESAITLKFPITNFSGKVTISAFAITTKKVTNFRSDDFVDDFQNYKFHLKQHSILAVDDGYSFSVNYDEENDNKVSSIFTIIKQENAGETVSYSSDQNKIVIYLNPEIFKIYETLKNESRYNNIFFASLVIPVLTSCLQEIQNKTEDTSWDEIYDETPWFRSVMKRYAHVKGKELDYDTFSSINCFELAQLLMDNTTDKCIQDFYNMTINVDEDQEDE